MDDNEKQILEDILEQDGDCLKWQMCKRCPFANRCLIRTIVEPKSTLSHKERVNLALNKLTNYFILNDEEVDSEKP